MGAPQLSRLVPSPPPLHQRMRRGTPSSCGRVCAPWYRSEPASWSSTAPAFPKQGTASVVVAREYCGALGKIANCQTSVTVALWPGARAWILGEQLCLPETWLTPAQRTRADPDSTRFKRNGAWR